MDFQLPYSLACNNERTFLALLDPHLRDCGLNTVADRGCDNTCTSVFKGPAVVAPCLLQLHPRKWHSISVALQYGRDILTLLCSAVEPKDWPR